MTTKTRTTMRRSIAGALVAAALAVGTTGCIPKASPGGTRPVVTALERLAAFLGISTSRAEAYVDDAVRVGVAAGSEEQAATTLLARLESSKAWARLVDWNKRYEQERAAVLAVACAVIDDQDERGTVDDATVRDAAAAAILSQFGSGGPALEVRNKLSDIDTNDPFGLFVFKLVAC